MPFPHWLSRLADCVLGACRGKHVITNKSYVIRKELKAFTGCFAVLTAAFGLSVIFAPTAWAQDLSSDDEQMAQFEEDFVQNNLIKFPGQQNKEISSSVPLDLRELIEKEKRLFKKKGWQWQEVEEAVDFAVSKTGIRKEFLIGMLAVESDLGRNTGECSYGEVEQGARTSYQNGQLPAKSWRTFQRRRALVKQVADDLDYDYKELRVSCNPARYVGTGGAMGVPQFMPDTWFEYKSKVSKIVGKKHPDPWNLKDGIVAMAVKLSDVPGVTQHNIYSEKNAAKMYLSGTTSRQYDWYANRIQYWARNYRSLIAQVPKKNA